MSLFCGHCDAAVPSECKCGSVDLYQNCLIPTALELQKLKEENKKLKSCVEYYASKHWIKICDEARECLKELEDDN